jgi:hypothetical protein
MLAALLAPDAGALPPVPGAVLWVDASTLSTGTFDAASIAVTNLGTQGGTFSAGPYSVNATGINGKPALEFDGTDDYLQSTNAYSNSGTYLKTSSDSSSASAGSSGSFGITSTVLGSRQRPLPTSENNYAQSISAKSSSTTAPCRIRNGWRWRRTWQRSGGLFPNRFEAAC